MEKKKYNKKVIISVVIIFLIMSFITGVWALGYNYADNKYTDEINALNAEIDELKNTPVVVDSIRPEIVQKIMDEKMVEISELATAEYQFTNAAKFTDTKHIVEIFDWMTEKSFVLKWDGNIKAGIDLDKVDISVEKEVIKISMPKPRILSYETDSESVEVLDEKNNVFNPITIKDKVGFDKETKKEMINRAIKNGLLEKSRKNAENAITNLLTTSFENIKDYRVEFKIVDKK